MHVFPLEGAAAHPHGKACCDVSDDQERPLKHLRGGSGKLLNVGTVNVTALYKNWHALQGVQDEIYGVTETRVTHQEQLALQRRIRSWHREVVWSPALQADIKGMSGRSGGTALVYTPMWTLLNQLEDLPLEAPTANWCGAHLCGEDRKKQLICVVYYGHPRLPSTTLQDLRYLEGMAKNIGIPMIVMGDFESQIFESAVLHQGEAASDTDAYATTQCQGDGGRECV